MMASTGVELMKAAHRVAAVVGLGTVLVSGVLDAQRPSGPPQPQAGRLPEIGPARPNRGNIVEKPAGVMPTVPAGFTVSVYAELQAPRMMVYAPNGDLFVSSPAANNITVFRDANNDGVFEARSVYAEGTPPAGRAGGGGGGQQAQPAGQRGAGAAAPAPPPAVNPAINGAILGTAAPACVPPPEFNNRGPGMVAAPFGMAFHGGYLYVGNTGSIVRFKYANGDL